VRDQQINLSNMVAVEKVSCINLFLNTVNVVVCLISVVNNFNTFCQMFEDQLQFVKC
jgi:hypothetical protein